MSYLNGRSYTNFKGLNIQAANGVIRFETPDFAPTTTSGERVLYVNSSNQLIFNDGSSSTVLGAAGGGGGAAPTWDAIYAGDQTLSVSSTTLTFDGTHASNNVVTLSNTAAGSGHLLQITNTGTGKDIRGTSGTWDVSALGAITGLSLVLAGTAASTSLSLTLGNIVTSAGGLSLTKAADNATLSVTNNSCATASMVVFAGSGTFTGSTTTSFMTVTPSGLTTGTAFYMPVAALTTGRGVHIVANALTSGIVMNVTSSATAITTTGRLFLSTHSGATGTSATLNEFITAATDETVLLKLTASGALALGTILQISGSSVTTGNAVTIADLDSLTDGYGLQIASAATAMTSTGRLLLVNHTGATGTNNILAEFKTAATDETTVVKITTAAMINGIALNIVGTTGMTSGSLIRATSSTAGAVATNGIYSFLGTGAFTTSASTVGMFHVAGASTVSGTIVSILGGSQTTGIALNITDPGTGMTSGSLLSCISATTAAVATNGIVSFQASGDFTSSSNQGFVGVIANSVTAGTIMSLSGTALTTGVGLYMVSSGTGLTSGSLLRISTGTTGAVATNGVVSITATADYTSTSNIGLLNVAANSLTAGTVSMFSATALTTGVILRLASTGTGLTSGSLLVATSGTTGAVATNGAVSIRATGAFTSTSNVGFVDVLASAVVGTGTVMRVKSSAASQTAVEVMRVEASGYTTGYSGVVMNVVGVATTGAAASTHSVLTLTGANTTGGNILQLSNNALTTGVGMLFAHTTSVIASGGSLVRLSSSSVDTSTSTGVILDLANTGSLAGTQVLGTFSALTTGIGVSVVAAATTTGVLFQAVATAATLTTGAYFQANDGGVNVFAVGRNGHLQSRQTTKPTIVVTTQNGITAAAVTSGSTDTCGIITTTGTNNNGGATVLTITFNAAYAVAPVVVLTGANASGSLIVPYISSTTTTTFVITIPASASSGATPSWYYQVLEMGT